jgi:hypothetical protein
MSDAMAAIPVHAEGSLLEVVDRLLEHGVIVQGDLEVSVAGVDLLSVGLKVFLASIDKADLWRRGISIPDEVTLELVAPAQKAVEPKPSGRDFLVQRRDGKQADAAMIAQLKLLASDHGGRLDPVEGRDLSGALRIAVRIGQQRRIDFLDAVARDLPVFSLSKADLLPGARE